WEWHYLLRLLEGDILRLHPSGGTQSVDFSPEGTLLASAGKTVQLWDVRTGQEIRLFPGPVLDGHYRNVAFSPDGAWLASATAGGTVQVWEAATGRPLHALAAHTSVVHGVAFSPDGGRLASASEDRTVCLWDPADGRLLHTIRGDTEFFKVAFSPDGTQIAAGGSDRTVTVWEAATRR